MEKNNYKLSRDIFDFKAEKKISPLPADSKQDQAKDLIESGILVPDAEQILNLYKTNQKLNEKISTLKRRFNKFLDEQKAKKTLAENKFSELIDENKRINTLMHEKDESLYQLRSENEFLKSQVEDMKNSLFESADQVVKWQSEMKLLASQVESLMAQKKSITPVNEPSLGINSILKKITELSRKMSVLKGIIKKLRADREFLMDELKTARISLSVQKNYLQDIHNRLVSSKSKQKR